MMSRWKRLSSERFIATTLVLFATSVGGLAGCEIISKVDRSQIGNGGGGAGGEGGTAGTGGAAGNGGATCMPVDDDNDCTTDECVDGKPVNTPLASGTTCMTNGGSLCDDMGACVECLMPSDCPGVDDTCQTRTCTMGKCGFDYAPADTAVPMQTAGDCKLKVCDGNGAQVDNVDDTDLPDDKNACTDDVCTAGVPTNPSKAQGANCGMNGNGDPLVCNDMAQCVGCNNASDCPGTDDECKQRTCGTDGVCGVSFTAANTQVMAQTANDCLLHVCDGSGSFVDIADDTDTPLDDGNACTGETCSMGAPNHPPLADGSACSDGDLCTPMDSCQMGICTAGMAITCMASDQCHVAGTCDPMTGMCSNPNAPDGTTCSDGDACTQTDACQAGTCTGANPVMCMASDQCHIAGTCDPMTGMCSNPNAMDGTTCSDGNACTQTDACQAGTCTGANPVTCTPLGQCSVAGTCDPMTGTCSNPNAMDGTMCTSNSVAGVCTMGACVACGDGTKTAAEGCDDGNTTVGDGCNATCAVEMGYTCTGTAPSVCTPTCGDGNIVGSETCDDSNTTNGDGCSSTCQIEITCGAGEQKVIVRNTTPVPIVDNVPAGSLSPASVATTGGVSKAVVVVHSLAHLYTGDVDIFLRSPKNVEREVSTNNGTSGDNYTNTTFDDAAATAVTAGTPPYSGRFRPEQSFSTTNGTDFLGSNAVGTWNLRVADDAGGIAGTLNSWSLALCVNPNAYCGNGTPDPGEACDDGNTNNDDGCTDTCRFTCGNGQINGTEQCDDGNTTNGDGCSNTCQIDITCGAGETSVILTNSTSTAIPDGAEGGIASLINVTQTGVVRKVIPTINITHPATADVDVWLVSPYGVQRELTTDVSGANFSGTTFSDAAVPLITAATGAHTGTFKPEMTISDAAGFGNQSANGQWTLRVADDNATNTGTLNNWTIALCIDTAVTSVCGNGYVEPTEQCDDGNTTNGDGCSSTCNLEITCGAGETFVFQKSTGLPQIIPAGVAAGITSPITISDAGLVSKATMVVNSLSHTWDSDVSISLISPANTTLDISSGNGSSSDNYVSTVFADAAPTLISAVAATPPYRGYFRPEQAFTGVNAQSTNGAWTLKVVDSSTADAGLLSSWSLGLCVAPVPVCNNGTVDFGETCDDGNNTANDGCSATCTVEQGYACTGGGPGSCMLTCGNGTVTGNEQCDDSNTAANDGCSAVCLIEAGYTCTGAGPGSCLLTCGNGAVSGSEQCDDGNTASNDSCSATCQWESTAEAEPNGTTAQADASAVQIMGTMNITGGLTASDKDMFKVTVAAANTVVSFETFDSSGKDCLSMPSTRITLFDNAGAQLKQDVDTAGIGTCSELAVLLQPGTYYVQVDNSAGTAVPNYFFRTIFHTDNGNEVEPNDTLATSTSNPGRSSHIFGDHQVVTDTDWYSITVPQGASLRLETIEGDASETCESNGIDTTISLHNAAGTAIATNFGDTGRGFCSSIDGTGTTPADAGAKNLAAGTYFVKVVSYDLDGDAANLFNYRLVAIVR